jgi:hypothetical protein
MDSDGYGCVCVIWAIAFVVALVTFMLSGCDCGQQSIATAATEGVASVSQDSSDVSPTIEHANGCPLDAVAYDAPAFADYGNKSFRVTDRLSGASWWLLRMRGEWIVLPIMNTEVTNAG